MIEKEEIKAVEELVNRMLFDIIENLNKELRNLKISIIEKDLEIDILNIKLRRLTAYDKLLYLEELLLSEGHDIRMEELLMNLIEQKDDKSIFQIFDYMEEQCI